MSLPTTMKAVVIGDGKPVIKSDLPLPKLEDGYILVKAKAVAGNPTDWKHIRYGLGPQGAIIGVDVAGEIVKIGENVDTTKFKLGDNVYGFVHGSSHRRPDNGAYAEYVALDSKLTFTTNKGTEVSGKDSLPEGIVDTLEGGATVPCSWLTAGTTLFHHMKLKMEWESKTPQRDSPVLIWGGATALGQPMIQLLKKVNGFTKIIAVASKKHEKQLKEYGADEIFDYHDADVIDQIKTKYENIEWLVDCVSNKDTLNQVYRCGSGKVKAIAFNYNVLSIEDIEPQYRNENVSIEGTMIYAAVGHPVKLGPYDFPQDLPYREDVIKFVNFVNPYLSNGPLHHIPVKIRKNGLESLIQNLDDIEQGRNSGVKLVATF